MRVMVGLVAGMGVLIVAGIVVVVVTIVGRAGGTGSATTTILDQPAGTRIAGASAAGALVTMVLQGGGPDRVLVIDTHSGRQQAKVILSH